MSESITGDQSAALALLVAALDAVGVEYFLTGSVAAGFYGNARMSNDLDVVIRVPRDRRPLVKVLSEDFEEDAATIDDALREPRMFNVITRDTVTKIDIIPHNTDMNPGDVFARRRRIALGDDEIAVISPEDLIIAKLIWAKDSRSEMQFRDIRGLLARTGLEREYLEETAARAGLGPLLRELDAGH